MKFTYLFINFFSVIIPFLYSFHPKLKFNKQFRPFFAANIISAIIFLVWDAVFTINGTWGFNNDYIIGWKIFYLPVEEILFFICIPFACLFTYHCINIFYKIKWNPVFENIIIILFSLVLLITGILNSEKDYTAVTFISTALLLLSFKFIFKVKWLPNIFTIYILLLIPFFIVNGLLTGTGLESPVVWYNNSENLAFRLLTIPIEDIFYGFELIILNIFFYEKFKHGLFADKKVYR